MRINVSEIHSVHSWLVNRTRIIRTMQNQPHAVNELQALSSDDNARERMVRQVMRETGIRRELTELAHDLAAAHVASSQEPSA